MKVCNWAEKFDKIIFKFMYFVSILAGLSLILTALLCTVDSLSAKIFSYSIPNGTDWVTYLNIPIVFLAMGYIQVERGNTVVDLLSSKFPKALNKSVQVFGSLLGAAVSIFVGYCEFNLTLQKLSTGARASSAANSFVVWPFALIIAIGYFLVGLSFLWGVFRVLFIAPERRMGAMVPEVSADGPAEKAMSDGKGTDQNTKIKADKEKGGNRT